MTPSSNRNHAQLYWVELFVIPLITAVIFFAVLTAVGGGIIRDIIVNKIPAVFRKHVYAVAAIIGAVVFYSLKYFNIDYSESFF